MAKKVRLLTDSQIKKEQSLQVAEKQALEAELKKYKRSRPHYTDDCKIDTIKTYLALGGNLSLTAHTVGIPYDTLTHWKATNWWKTLVEQVRKQEKLELSAKAKRIVAKTFEVMADRVANGDFIYNQKTGELIRKPLSAKDAHHIGTDLMERADKLDLDTQEEGNKKDKDEDRLKALAERFADLALKKLERHNKPTIEVTDVVFATEELRDATDEQERDEGLQSTEDLQLLEGSN